MNFDIIGLGECMVELYANQSLGVATILEKSYGGDVLNTLVHASRLGSRTAFISKVGNDPFGLGLLKTWQIEGVDTSQVPLVEGENGVYFISLLENGEREFTYRRANSAASQIIPSDLNPNFIASSRLILLSGITQAISSSAAATTLAAAQIAREHGVLVAFDPNYRPKLWALRGGLEAARAAALELLPLVDVLLPSAPTDLELLSQDQMRIVPVVALKSGAEGVWINQTHVPAHVVQVVDTTGAGDAWNAGFLYFYLQTNDLILAAREAHGVAGRKIQARGAIPPR